MVSTEVAQNLVLWLALLTRVMNISIKGKYKFTGQLEVWLNINPAFAYEAC
jgi:hypothetical protein